jgi:hypothetical protein
MERLFNIPRCDVPGCVGADVEDAEGWDREMNIKSEAGLVAVSFANMSVPGARSSSCACVRLVVNEASMVPPPE